MNTAGNMDTLFRVPFGTQLSLLVGQIAEVYPGVPATGGARQELRLRAGEGGPLFSVHIFDYSQPIPQRAEGSFLRVSASPAAKRAIVWERSKAVKPTATGGVGTLVVRKNAAIEILPSLAAANLVSTGFRAVEAAPELPLAPRHDPAPSPAPVTAPAPERSLAPPARSAVDEVETPALVEVCRRFARCLQAARQALGPDAPSEDVQAAARVAYAECYRTPKGEAIAA